MKIKMSLKIKFDYLRTNNEPFLCLRTNNTLSLGDFDEYETHLFLMKIRELKIQFNAKLWNLHPDLCFVGK